MVYKKVYCTKRVGHDSVRNYVNPVVFHGFATTPDHNSPIRHHAAPQLTYPFETVCIYNKLHTQKFPICSPEN